MQKFLNGEWYQNKFILYKIDQFFKKTIDFRFFFVYLNRNKCSDSH